jgi:trans-2,3-dihydro-3-hydroxyanthranilate isomerase
VEKQPFCIVDVFAEEKYTGNPLAVFTDAAALSPTEMQKIAREVNYSETTFILYPEPRQDGYDVRIFTPQKEISFAGHPTLGTAFVIQQSIIHEPVEEVVLNLKVGQIPVTFSYKEGRTDILWMKQIEPTFGRSLDPRSISQVLSIDESKIDDRFPIEEVSTGLPALIVPLKDLESLKQIQVVKDRYFDLIKDISAKLILVFSSETHSQGSDLSVRVFADYYGVPEDPATGSANGCLAGYLVRYRYLEDTRVNVRVEQGYDIGRPSLLLLKAEEKGGKINISVGGRVIQIAEGVFV